MRRAVGWTAGRPRWRAALALAVLAVLALAAGAPSPAAADPAGPTDYRSEVVELSPAAEGRFTVEIVGGDSFVALTVPTGTAIEVIGYQGEPYLRFDPDGGVYRNERSPTRWLNDQRYGEVAVPAEATAGAEPAWTQVSADGSYAWHDHRAHWMAEQKPPGANPGDIVLEADIPLRVDGDEATVRVRSVLLDPPAWWPSLVGVVLGMAVVAAVAMVRRGTAVVAAALILAWSVAALVMGLWAFTSVPSVTGPTPLLWALPVVAMLAAAAAIPAAVRWPPSHPRRTIPVLLLALAGVEVAAWSWIRREALVRSLIPSGAPAPLDRALVAGGFLMVVAAAVAAVLSLGLLAAPRGREAKLAPR